MPGTSPERPSSSHENAQTTPITAITRVRRRPSIRCSTTSWSTTMTSVFAAKASPSARVETSPTPRAYAGMPALSWE